MMCRSWVNADSSLTQRRIYALKSFCYHCEILGVSTGLFGMKERMELRVRIEHRGWGVNVEVKGPFLCICILHRV